MKRMKKWIAILLVSCMMADMIPVDVFAQNYGMESSAVNEASEEGNLDSEIMNLTDSVENANNEQLEVLEQSENVNSQESNGATDTTENIEQESEVEVSRSISELYQNAFAKKFATVLQNNGYSTEKIQDIILENGNEVTLKIVDAQAEILALLSKQQQSESENYANWKIQFPNTGNLTLTPEFEGLGDEEFPFCGAFTGQSISIISQNTIFKALDAGADLNKVQIVWMGTPDKAILTNKLFVGTDDCNISMSVSSAKYFSPYIGQLIVKEGVIGEKGVVTLPALDYSGATESAGQEKYVGDTGLVCGQMQSGTRLKVASLKLPSLVTLLSTGNAGCLVGSMEEGSELMISETLSLSSKINADQAAGGLVGKVNGGSISFSEGKSITVSANLNSPVAAGGIFGDYKTSTGAFLENANVILQSVSVGSTKAAGVYYGSVEVNGIFIPLQGISVKENAELKVLSENSGSCGGVFGELKIIGDGKCTISGTETENVKIQSQLVSATNNSIYGGIVGTLSGDAAKNALVVNECEVISAVSVPAGQDNNPKYLAGIAAKQITATIEVSSTSVKIQQPKTKSLADYGFGGIVSQLSDNTLLIAEQMTIKTDSYSDTTGGGSVVGKSGKGSIVYLKGSLDISKCQLYTCAQSGQIVGYQDCSLIYAPGVSINRLYTTVGDTQYSGMELDDIGNYGELYRIDGFLNIDTDYSRHFNKLGPKEGVYEISSTLDYASFALAWQSRGYFPTIEDINKDTWGNLKSCKVKLNNTLDLTECGIGGLSRDISSDEAFSGEFDGNNNTITLDIGSQNTANQVSKGDGRIYYHDATGLFAKLDSSARVNNLTIAGNIRVSNSKMPSPGFVGGLAATLTCNTVQNASTINGVSNEIKIDAITTGANKIFYVGGLFGNVSGSSNAVLNLNKNISANIKISNSKDYAGHFVHIGGAIGAIQANANLTINCNDGAKIGGRIEYTNTLKNAYAGGLIGTIIPRKTNGAEGKRTINLTKLEVNGFSIKANASDRMGGILGCIWANTDVIVKDVEVTNTEIKADGTAPLGGLVYRSSGKWDITKVNLSGLKINAPNVNALGLMVCQGGSYKETINTDSSNTEYYVDGLYLNMVSDWDVGYFVPSKGNITFNNNIFDEFVAYTACSERSMSTPVYDIMASGSGIISLKTSSDTVSMEDGDGNTYFNRTDVGNSKKTNLYSRYYYNLPTVKKICDEDTKDVQEAIDTAAELLIWSVYHYAAPNLKDYFKIDNVSSTTIGGLDADNKADFNMNGLSYYPISMVNSNVTVRYANIEFYNEQIESKETDNKTTRGDMQNHSQHYTMHCGLFMDCYSDLNATSTVANYSLTVNGVSFVGSIGVINGGSGALICGNVKGDTKEGNISSCSIILADEDREDKKIVLNGISVVADGEDSSYRPVLINKLGSYTGIEANYITSSNEQKTIAGSSLIGDVGEENAKNISVAFKGTIKLPENGVFTKAILLNSLRYDVGSATYNFYKEKDWNNAHVHGVTYGKEITTTVEYEGEQGCYYDKFGKGYFISVDGSNFDSANDFSNYLPYVYQSPATSKNHPIENGWHEIAVNVLAADLIEGCGTYGHPYVINTYGELKAIANCINNGKYANGWQVRVKSNEEYHVESEGSFDEVLTYQDGWKRSDQSSYQADIQTYLANAYYCISNDLTLKNFPGLGTEGTGGTAGVPFEGVIIAKEKTDGTMPILTLQGSTPSLIKYSYGSVLRNLSLKLEQNITLRRIALNRTDNLTTAQTAPNTFYGGVIGCVLGGDNIIDNVSVSKGENMSVTDSTDSVKPHLVPKGAYIGVIAGGGVIFRGTISSSADILGSDNTRLYTNPIIGRVLGGYAFYEGSSEAPNNTNKNYKINKISGENSLSWNGGTLTVNDAQGLLVLSGIVSSGAGSKESKAYKIGKVRNASYEHIGEDASTASSDYAIASNDEKEAWKSVKDPVNPNSTINNTPYLLNKYASYTGNSGICTSSSDGIHIKFAENGIFNMDNFDNGYRGLSARYVSNAAFNEENNVDPRNVIMRVNTFDGQNTDVKNINMNVREYEDDDFHAASLGGIFNIVWTKNQSGGVSNHTFAQNLSLTNCNVTLQYVDSNNQDKNEADKTTMSEGDGRCCVTVGGFLGSVSNLGTSDLKKCNYLLSNIHISGNSSTDRCSVTGPNSVGGLIGAAAMTVSGVTGCPGIILSNNVTARFAPSFLNCSYAYINITGMKAAGGLAGYVYAGGATPNFVGLGKSGERVFASCTVTESNMYVGKDSKITTRAKFSVAGGVFGGVGLRLGINYSDVNKETGLTVIGDGKELSPVRFEKVTIESFESKSIIIKTDNNSYDGPSSDGSMAGGIVGRIGNVNPTYFYNIVINEGNVKTNQQDQSDKHYAGGLVGSGYTNTSIYIQHCQVKKTTIDSKCAGGFLGYGYTKDGFNLHLSDCKIEDSTIKGSTTPNNSNGNMDKIGAGGLVGLAAGKYYLFNILMKNNKITGLRTGRLLGYKDQTNFELYAVGISCFVDSEKAIEEIPVVDAVGLPDDYVGYIAYADYAGKDTKVDNNNSPYVTVNPNYELKMNDGTTLLLAGDAVGKIQNDTYNSVTARIWADSMKDANNRKNKVTYTKASATIAGKKVPSVSNFNAEQGCGPDDLPVLVLGAGDATMIEDYLNVITNGAYDKKTDVKATSNVFYYDDKSGKFAEATSDQLKKEPASVWFAAASDDRSPRIRQNSYDNTRKRFTLITADFNVTVSGTLRTYTVHIPVIVKRELQYNFMSTFSYGTEFMSSSFDEIKTHVLESTGNPVTAYLTYQYNREKKDFVAYEWQSYLDDGENMMGVDKILEFSTGLPSGTQLLLVDCQDGNQAYQLTTEGTSVGSITKIKLSEFTSVTDPNKNFRASMADILGVTREPKTDGKFVEAVSENDLSKASIRLDNHYYRRIKEGETVDEGIQRYDFIVPDLSLDKNIANENYYLVINVPKQEDDNFYINGALSSTLEWSMPSKGTWVHRYNVSKTCTGDDDESTYQISSGYRQNLTTELIARRIDLTDETNKIQVFVKDEITFSNRQVYGDADQLFLKFTVDLQSHEKTGDNKETVEPLQFPAGSTGDVEFYITDNVGNYYVPKDSGWEQIQTKPKPVSYKWISQGGNMELLLSEDGLNALDLSGVRKIIKDNKSEGESQIFVTAKMNVDFNGQEVLNKVIPASENNGTDQWATLHYTAKISTQKDSISYSTVRVTMDDPIGYYLGIRNSAILTMDARNISQLGINPLELVPEYLSSDKKKSRIDIVALLSFEKLASSDRIADFLKNTENITFKLSLLKGGRKVYEEQITEEQASNYITFDKGMSWNISQSQYYDKKSNQMIISDIFDGTQFMIPITAYVNVEQKEYSNYKIRLEVSFSSDSGMNINDVDSYVVYTYACIKPEFYVPT